MRETPISPLRRRMIEDMTVRNFVEKTRHDDIRHVKTFTAFLGRSPDRATPEDLRRFQLHQTETGVRPPTVNGAVAALRFFFSVTLDRSDLARHLTFVREPRRIPVVLSPEEVARLLEAAPGPKYKAALSAAYGAGLRVSEVVALKVSYVDSTRMLLRIEQGKGRRDRHAMLSPQLLELLRDWWRIARPPGWLFPGRDPMRKRPFAGPQAVLAHLARYTHRVAIANSRLIAANANSVTFKWKDYRFEGRERHKTMTLATHEFIRRFLIHVLQRGLHRIRHHGLLANGTRAETIARARELLAIAAPETDNTATTEPAPSKALAHPCPCCGGRMIIIETFEPGTMPRARPPTASNPIRIDTS